MSDEDKDAGADKRSTVQMESKDLHFHVLELVMPADWKQVTPQFWSKDRDSMETYEAVVDGFKLQVEMKSIEVWMARVECADGSVHETAEYRGQAPAVRALVELFDEVR